MAEPLRLPSRLDLPAATPLAAMLTSRLGEDHAPVVVDAGQVSHLGALCLQVLLAAAAECRAVARPIRFAPRSPAFDEALSIFGLSASSLDTEIA